MKLDGVLDKLRGIVRRAISAGIDVHETFEMFDPDFSGEIGDTEFRKVSVVCPNFYQIVPFYY